MRGIARVGRRGPKDLKRRKFCRPWDASEGVSKPWRCPASPPDRPAPCFLPDAAQGRSLGVSIIKIWYQVSKVAEIAVCPLRGIRLGLVAEIAAEPPRNIVKLAVHPGHPGLNTRARDVLE